MAISLNTTSSLREPLLPREPKPPCSPLRVSLLTMVAGASTMALFFILLSLAPCLISGSCYHGYQSPFSFDLNKAHHPEWMKDVPDHVNITSLSIPGTHDTMTFNFGREGADRFDSRLTSLQCQNWNLTLQLEAGLRYFDIRARIWHNDLWIYHADGFTGFTYQNVLDDMYSFLDKHPSEMLVMRLKEEGPPLGKRKQRTFEAAFNDAHFNRTDDQGPDKHLALYNDTSKPIPTLGELRSKVFLLQNFPSENSSYGLAWEGPQMVLEDKWIIDGVNHLPEKWAAIEPALQQANSDPLDNKHIYLAHISAAVGLLPIEAAAGPLNRTQVGMNVRTGEWLENHVSDKGAQRTGIIIFDFPGKRAIEAVLAFNKHVAKRLGR